MMISQEIKDYEAVLNDCYSSDPEFLEKYHDDPGTDLESAVLRDSNLFSLIPGYVMKDVTKDDKRVGYFGIDTNYDPPFMFGFFVKPEFRNKEDLSEFWQKVKESFPSYFLGACSPNNTKAIDYMSNRGGENFLKGRDVVILKFKN